MPPRRRTPDTPTPSVAAADLAAASGVDGQAAGPSSKRPRRTITTASPAAAPASTSASQPQAPSLARTSALARAQQAPAPAPAAALAAAAQLQAQGGEAAAVFPLLDALALYPITKQLLPHLSSYSQACLRASCRAARTVVDAQLGGALRVGIDAYHLAAAHTVQQQQQQPAKPTGRSAQQAGSGSRAADIAAAVAAVKAKKAADKTKAKLSDLKVSPEDATAAVDAAAVVGPLLQRAAGYTRLHLSITDAATGKVVPTRVQLPALLQSWPNTQQLTSLTITLPAYDWYLSDWGVMPLKLQPSDIAAIAAACPSLTHLHLTAPHLPAAAGVADWGAAFARLPGTLRALRLYVAAERVGTVVQALGRATQLAGLRSLDITHRQPVSNSESDIEDVPAAALVPIASHLETLELPGTAKAMAQLLAACGATLRTWVCHNAREEPLSQLLPLAPSLTRLTLKDACGSVYVSEGGEETAKLMPAIMRAVSACTRLTSLDLDDSTAMEWVLGGKVPRGYDWEENQGNQRRQLPTRLIRWQPPPTLQVLTLHENVPALGLELLLAAAPSLTVHLSSTVSMKGVKPGQLQSLAAALQAGRLVFEVSDNLVLPGCLHMADTDGVEAAVMPVLRAARGAGGSIVQHALQHRPPSASDKAEAEQLVEAMAGVETLLLQMDMDDRDLLTGDCITKLIKARKLPSLSTIVVQLLREPSRHGSELLGASIAKLLAAVKEVSNKADYADLMKQYAARKAAARTAPERLSPRQLAAQQAAAAAAAAQQQQAAASKRGNQPLVVKLYDQCGKTGQLRAVLAAARAGAPDPGDVQVLWL